jgi:hypothetical protein
VSKISYSKSSISSRNPSWATVLCPTKALSLLQLPSTKWTLRCLHLMNRRFTLDSFNWLRLAIGRNLLSLSLTVILVAGRSSPTALTWLFETRIFPILCRHPHVYPHLPCQRWYNGQQPGLPFKSTEIQISVKSRWNQQIQRIKLKVWYLFHFMKKGKIFINHQLFALWYNL